jgi:hypothetical protein
MPTIDAKITKVEQDQATGWYRITTEHDRVQRVETKKHDLAEQAAELMREGVMARIEFTERDSQNINPHTNKPYLNRYYEGAVPLVDPRPQQQIEQVSTGRKTDPNDAWRMCLNKGGELALRTLPMMPTAQRGFDVQRQIARAWAEFFYFTGAPAQPSDGGEGVTQSQFQKPSGPIAAVGHPGAYHDPTAGESAPPPGDDDIPF